VSSLKLGRLLPCGVRFVFVSTFNLQRGRAFFVGITNLSKWAVCVKAKAPAILLSTDAAVVWLMDIVAV
jgi:hypothetical protein